MQNCALMPVGTPGASQGGTLVIEQFLMENYRFRRNILNGKVEFAILPKAEHSAQGNTVDTIGSLSCASNEADLEYRTLTQTALNSIIIRAKREQVLEKGSPKTEITEYVQSEEVPEHNPVQAFLQNLPIRSAVAHWMQLDMLHGNECVPTLIGPQGCGKTTFVRRLLPLELREYYMDHLNLANKFDKEMALTNNLLVNIDELESIRDSQQSSLKQTLSVSKVNSRPIFGRAQEDRPRFASFVATTNNRHPLKDATGSRRYICIQIPDGQMIDNTGEIDYGQLYAQVLYELNEQKAPYWFNNDEVARLQQLNQDFMEKKDIGEMFTACFRKPNEGEAYKTMNCGQIIEVIQKDYPTLENTIGNKIRLGKVISALGFDFKDHSHIPYYEVIPLRVA